MTEGGIVSVPVIPPWILLIGALGIASALGLPVSSTHIAIGALFGVGFLREFMANRRSGRSGLDTMPLEAPARETPGETAAENPPTQTDLPAPAQKLRKRYLVRRRHLLTIVAAWLVTVPASAAVAAVLALALSLAGLPL